MFDSEVRFTVGNSSSIPASAGVYVFYDLKGAIYVGRTSSLHKRYLEHYEKTHNLGLRQAIGSHAGILRFAWKSLPEQETYDEEKQWISELNPKSNVIRYKK